MKAKKKRTCKKKNKKIRELMKDIFKDISTNFKRRKQDNVTVVTGTYLDP